VGGVVVAPDISHSGLTPVAIAIWNADSRVSGIRALLTWRTQLVDLPINAANLSRPPSSARIPRRIEIVVFNLLVAIKPSSQKNPGLVNQKSKVNFLKQYKLHNSSCG
jgi:hypothetical protein